MGTIVISLSGVGIGAAHAAACLNEQSVYLDDVSGYYKAKPKGKKKRARDWDQRYYRKYS